MWVKKVYQNTKYILNMKKTFITNVFVGFFLLYQKERGVVLRPWSRFVPVNALVLLRPAPPQRVHVFGSQPRVPAQRRLSQAERQQPVSHTHRLQTTPSSSVGYSETEAHLATTSSRWRSSADTLSGSSFLMSTKSSSID